MRTHSLLQEIKQLLDTLVHTAGISLQHQLRSLRLLIFRVNSCESYDENKRILARSVIQKRNQSVTAIKYLLTANDH